MRFTKFIIILFILNCLSVQGQEWSSRISIVEKHLLDDNDLTIFVKGEVEASANTKEMVHFFSADASFNLFSYETKSNTIGIGFQGMFEEILPSEQITIKDFLVYSFESYINITKSIRISLNVENFLNFNDNSFELEPVNLNGDRLANLTILEPATAHFINVSINYSF